MEHVEIPYLCACNSYFASIWSAFRDAYAAFPDWNSVSREAEAMAENVEVECKKMD